jgi:cytochrome c oxidase subunit 3
MTTPNAAAADAAASPGAGKLGMWIFLVTDAMGFGGLLLAYGVLRARAEVWPDPAERLSVPLAAAMTLALLVSSLAVMLALAAVRERRRGQAAAWLAITVMAGIAFLGGQAAEYRELILGPQRMGLRSDLFASLFYVITGFHGLHVLSGVVYLTVLLVLGAKGRVSVVHYQVAALFWHFVDFAWIPIFTFVYLLPAG